MRKRGIMIDYAAFMWNIYNSITDQIKFCDTKATAILASNGVILSIIFSKSIDNIQFLKSNKLVLFDSLLIFTFGILSIYYCVKCLSPRLENNSIQSIIFFEDIAQYFNTPDEYDQVAGNIAKNDAEFTRQISHSIWIISKIASKKYNYILKAVKSFKYMILFIIINGVLILTLFYINNMQILSKVDRLRMCLAG
jgi:hypothetical protein